MVSHEASNSRSDNRDAISNDRKLLVFDVAASESIEIIGRVGMWLRAYFVTEK